MVELAFDFSGDSGVDARFVKQHALFGKSQPCDDNRFPNTFYYGGRKSAKLVRCYYKEEVAAFRVELELHTPLIASVLATTQDIPSVTAVAADHMRFVRLDFRTLEAYLRSRFGKRRGAAILDRARTKTGESIHSAARYLRSKGVANIHRFYVDMKVNNRVSRGLDSWIDVFGGPGPYVRSWLGKTA